MKRALGFVPLRWLSRRDGGMLSDNFGGIERNFFIACARVSRKLRRLGGLDEPDRNPICWMGVRSYRFCDNPSKVGQLEADRNRSDIPSILYRGSTPLLPVSSATGAADIAAHRGRPKQYAHATAAINAESSISVTSNIQRSRYCFEWPPH